MDFTPQTGRTTGNGSGGFTIQTGRTKSRVGNGSSSYAAATQTRHEYSNMAPAKNYAKKPASKDPGRQRTMPKNQPVARSARPGKGYGNPSGQNRAASPDLIERMFQGGVHIRKVPVRVNLKKGQRLA